MEELSAEVRAKGEELRAQQEEARAVTVQCERLKEEVNAYKGRCANLQRDVQVSQGYLEKVTVDSAGQTEQFGYLRDRVRSLEGDLERALRDKTDAACEAKRLQAANEGLERQLQEAKVSQIRV